MSCNLKLTQCLYTVTIYFFAGFPQSPQDYGLVEGCLYYMRVWPGNLQQGLEIKRRESSIFENCVIIIGMFHVIAMFMNILFKQFAAASLKDALIQRIVVKKGPVEIALHGKSYNRGLQLYKLFYEAQMRLWLDNLAET